MTILECNYLVNGDEQDQVNPTQMEDHQDISQVQSSSLLRHMKISNEFVAIKEYVHAQFLSLFCKLY